MSAANDDSLRLGADVVGSGIRGLGMTSETHRSVSEVIRDISAQFVTETPANSHALHLFDDELEALRRAEQNILAQIHRLEREQLQRLNRLTTERDERFEASRVAIFDALSAQNILRR